MLGRTTRRRQVFDIWPGFVDALATLLIIIIFVLLIFVLAQFFLGQTLSGREEALDRLNRELSQLSEMLSLERQGNEELRLALSQMSNQLTAANARIEVLDSQVRDATETRVENEELRDRLAAIAQLEQDVAALEALRDSLAEQIAEMDARLADAEQERDEAERALTAEQTLSAEARAQAALLNRQIEQLQNQLAAIQEVLEASEARRAEQEVQIIDLGNRLNAALADKVQELQRYRSEFFGRLRALLGDREDVAIVGDRFVFQSEVLFPSGSNQLQPAGQRTLADLAQTLRTITAEIPEDIDWILRVDGHTDKQPIRTASFASNWDLSAARAISVVEFLIAEGLPADRLAAAGFGEFQPIDDGDGSEALARNRRIEIKLDQR